MFRKTVKPIRKKSLYILSGVVISVFTFFLILVIHSALIRVSTEKYVNSLMQDCRREIISGDRTFALRHLEQKLGNTYGIVEIAYSSPGYSVRYLDDNYRKGKEKTFYGYVFLNEMHKNIYFDSQEKELAFSFVFLFHRYSNFEFSFISWLSFCAILSIILAKFYRFEKRNEKVRVDFERAAMMARVVQMLSHDMRAPLGTIERLLHIPPENFSEMKVSIRESLNRLNAMIESLRHTELEVMVKRTLHPINFFAGIEGVQRKAIEQNITLVFPEDGIVQAWIDPLKFERAWLNLVINAVEVAKSIVRVELHKLDKDICLRVIDDGPGVSIQILPKLFQRGVTHGKPGGSGLGLAYVRQIMRGHGGDITYRRDDSFSIFECRLPNAAEPGMHVTSEGAVSSEIYPVQKLVRKVAICLEPDLLGMSILNKLTAYKSDEFFFSKERKEAKIVVSNVDDIMFEVVESDEQEFLSVASFNGEETRIIDLLIRKFNLTEGNQRV